MNFPADPSNGQITTINGIVYVYDDIKTAWKRSTSLIGNITTTGNIISSNVITGNVYTTSGIYWSGNGVAYSGGSSNFLYTASATAPGSPTKGDQWFDTTDGTLYEYIDDGDSFQWIDIHTPTFSSIDTTTDVPFSSNISVAGNIFITNGIFWNGNNNPYSAGGGSGVDDTIRANVGAYQIYANANIGTLHLGNISTQTNIGAFYNYANANIGRLHLGNISTQTNIGTLFLGNATTNANLGAYQIWANATFASATYSNTNVAAYLTRGANIGSGSTTANLVAAATTTSTSTTTGALVVRGGMGVAGAAYFGGVTRVTDSTASTSNSNGALIVTGGAGIMGALNVGTTGTFSSGAASTTTGTGALIVVGGVGIGGALNVGSSGSFAGLLQATASTASTSSSSGAFYVAGGAGIVGNLHVDGNVVLGSGTSSNLVVKATTTSTDTTTGALVVRGGVGVAGRLNVGGNIVAGSGIGSTNTTSGALVVVGGVGISGAVYTGGTLRTGGGLTVPSGGITITGDSTVSGGYLQVLSGYNSTNTGEGALTVQNSGGLGVTGNIHANKLYTVNGLFWSGNSNPFSVEASNTYGSNLVAASGTPSTSINTGALVVAGVGGLGVGGDLNATAGSTVNGWTVGGLLWAACTTPATSATSGGGLLVNGGARILGNVYASGNIYLGANTSSNLVANATTTSTSTTTGSFVVRGGAGIAGNLYVGNEFVIPGGGKVTSSGLANFLEKANVVATSPAAIVNVDLTQVSVMYWTSNASANITANIRGDADTPLNSLLAVGQSITSVLFIPNGISNYYINTVKIDNTTVSPAYQGNAAPTLGNPNSVDIYSFTILKTADATYKVFASQTQFMHPG
jgi:hypothetical protein